MSNTKIWATETEAFDIGCRVVKWNEKDGMDLTKYWKYTNTGKDYEELQDQIKQFTVHWADTYTAKVCYSVLKNRGLSCNFIIDDNEDEDGFATIYQCLPINKLGWSQGSLNGKSFNSLGPGVELAYRPIPPKSRYNGKHDIVKTKVHGQSIRVYVPTEAQMKSLSSLIWGFSELFPDVPPEFPRKSDGTFVYKQLKNPHDYTGLVSHYHLRRAKIDAAGIDMQKIEDDVDEMMAVGYNIHRQI